jgi:hypothetical protein
MEIERRRQLALRRMIDKLIAARLVEFVDVEGGRVLLPIPEAMTADRTPAFLRRMAPSPGWGTASLAPARQATRSECV